MPGEVFTSHASLAAKHGWTDDDCAGTLRFFTRDDTFAQARCDRCDLEVAVPVRELDPAVRTAQLLSEAGFPQRFVSKSFAWSTENARVVNALGEWAARETLTPTPVLWGKPGRGKTHLMVVTARELVRRRNMRCWFVTAPSLLGSLQAAMKDDPEYNRLWRRAVSVELLLLDDLGAEMDTDWKADRIAALVDERYRADLPVFATTNIAPVRWGDAFDARTASRLHEMSEPYELAGVDRRQSTEGIVR